jgi:hypothetical protein
MAVSARRTGTTHIAHGLHLRPRGFCQDLPAIRPADNNPPIPRETRMRAICWTIAAFLACGSVAHADVVRKDCSLPENRLACGDYDTYLILNYILATAVKEEKWLSDRKGRTKSERDRFYESAYAKCHFEEGAPVIQAKGCLKWEIDDRIAGLKKLPDARRISRGRR